MARRRRLGAFRALAGNGALRRVVGGYALFILTEQAAQVAAWARACVLRSGSRGCG